MTTDIHYPDIDSDVYKLTETRVRKAIRLLLKEGHKFEPSKLLRRQEVMYAQKDCQIPDDLLNIIVFPLMDIRGWIWDEYANKRMWTLDEAACLSVGMDPFCYQLEPGQYYPGWRQEREHIFESTLDAIRSNELQAVREDGTYLIPAKDFCIWAEANDLLTSELAKPLKGLALANMTVEVLTPGETEERWQRYAQQRLYAEALSHAEVRNRMLFSYAIALKFDNPKLKREDIAKRAVNVINEDCQKLKGFKLSTIRKYLQELDDGLLHPEYSRLRFFNSVPTDKEIMSTNPTHRWWSLWRGVIARKLPYLVLPE